MSRRRCLAAGLASAGLLAAGLTSPAPLLAQDAAAPGPSPAPPAVLPPAPAAPAVPDPPTSALAPDPATPAPQGVQNESQPSTASGRVERARDRRRARARARHRADAARARSHQLDEDLRNALPAVGRLDVPSFFIDTFAVPPFLLSIYQAAGIEYGVRWEVLAAINEIETDYGRNISVSTAGAMGWMQFLPSTWTQYGVDASGDGRKDAYNPVDAIFAAARYLKAAGADRDLAGAIFAYNHAGWYVTRVLKRAQLLAALPADLVGALSGLAQGRPPVLGPARNVARDAKRTRTRTLVLATRSKARVVATTDGEIVRIGHSSRLGSFMQLRDVYGNTYTYGGLGRFARRYPVFDAATKPAAASRPEHDAPPDLPATAGAQRADASRARARRRRPAPTAVSPAASSAAVATAAPRDSRQAIAPARMRRALSTLAAFARRPRAFSALSPPVEGLAEQPAPAAARAVTRASPGAWNEPTLARLDHSAAAWSARRAARGRARAARATAPAQLTSYDQRLLGDVDARRVHYRPLRKGARVIAGTVLARSGPATAGAAPASAAGGQLRLEIRPAGHGAPRIDPRPIVAGWKLLRASQPTVAAEPSIGQVLLLGKRALERRVLDDRRVHIYSCGGDDIRAGRIDRRVLATLEMLASSGLHPTVSALACGHSRLTSSGRVSEHVSGNAVDISAINGTPILGHQGAGSITETAIRRLLTLQGTMKPHQIISLMRFDGADNTLALADHKDHIHVGFAPEHVPGSLAARQSDGVLEPRQWGALMDRLSRLPNPRVLRAP